MFNVVFAKEDPLLHNRTYGVIQNSGARRRAVNHTLLSEAPGTKFRAGKDHAKQPTETSTTPQTSNPGPTVKTESSPRPGSAGSTVVTSSKQPALKRDTSDIFKSFAKAKSKLTDENKETDASTNGDSPAQSGPEDTKMTDADEEGESEDEALFLDTKTRRPAKKRPSEEGSLTKDKHERAAKLRRMMDSEDESERLPTKAEEKKEGVDQKEAEEAAVAWSDSESEQAQAAKDGKSAEAESAPISAEPTRRRGRRKVMKKRTMKDEEGYLVTKEEAVWESFSEEETASQPKSKTALPMKAHSQQKGSAAIGKVSGKAAGKGGSIMSFFGKK